MFEMSNYNSDYRLRGLPIDETNLYDHLPTTITKLSGLTQYEDVYSLNPPVHLHQLRVVEIEMAEFDMIEEERWCISIAAENFLGKIPSLEEFSARRQDDDCRATFSRQKMELLTEDIEKGVQSVSFKWEDGRIVPREEGGKWAMDLFSKDQYPLGDDSEDDDSDEEESDGEAGSDEDYPPTDDFEWEFS